MRGFKKFDQEHPNTHKTITEAMVYALAEEIDQQNAMCLYNLIRTYGYQDRGLQNLAKDIFFQLDVVPMEDYYEENEGEYGLIDTIDVIEDDFIYEEE